MTVNRFLSIIAIIAVSASLSLAAMTICPGCGWEVDAGASSCSHCGQVIQKEVVPEDPEQKEPASEPAKIATRGASVEDSIVDAEVDCARKFIKAGDYELGRMFLKNAAILNALSASPDSTRSSAITSMLTEYNGSAMLVQSKCLSCDGTGKRMMKISSLIPGEATSREVQGSNCLACKGAGIVRRPGTMDERIFARGRAERRYETTQQGRKYERVGGAWLPPEVAGALSVKQTALVRSASSAPCEGCQGFGKIDCSACKSAGTIDCDACEDGNVFIKVSAELTKMTLSRSEKCKKCAGRGVLLCEKCGGSGGILCQKCNGNGQRPECRKCAGQGYTECRKCARTGTVKGEVCEYCRGEGYILCTSCNGDGHK